MFYENNVYILINKMKNVMAEIDVKILFIENQLCLHILKIEIE